jgi:NAD(P)H-dependent FMN reductase
MDEPNHPRLARYTRPHTKGWSAMVAAADAFVFVTPEYNYGMSPALLNAIDYVFHEWAYKAAGFVSYGGMSGGVRSVQMAKPVLTSVKVMPIPEAVAIPFFMSFVGKAGPGSFVPGETFDKSAAAMLDELHRWATALTPMRAAKP